MGRKSKGSNAERELAHLFHKHEWGVLRAAGSGSTTMPAPDILAGNRGKYLAIECKSTKDTKKYFPKEELEQLRLFAKNFGAEPWIGVRFDFLKWFFVHVDDIKKGKGKLYVITVDHARKKGKSFEELIGLFEQERLI